MKAGHERGNVSYYVHNPVWYETLLDTVSLLLGKCLTKVLWPLPRCQVASAVLKVQCCRSEKTNLHKGKHISAAEKTEDYSIFIT